MRFQFDVSMLPGRPSPSSKLLVSLTVILELEPFVKCVKADVKCTNWLCLMGCCKIILYREGFYRGLHSIGTRGSEDRFVIYLSTLYLSLA